MKTFNWSALDSSGSQNSGEIRANSQSEAVAALRDAGYFPTSVEIKGAKPTGRKKSLLYKILHADVEKDIGPFFAAFVILLGIVGLGGYGILYALLIRQ